MGNPMDISALMDQREQVLLSWPTGSDVDLEQAFRFHQQLPSGKVCVSCIQQAQDQGKILLQPRAGVALVDEHIRLLSYLQQEADILPTTIDAYTRQNRYPEAQKGIERSTQAKKSLLNGFPAVNHGVSACRDIIRSLDKPVEVRHGTPDARLLAEITLAGGFNSFEGGGISYNIPYSKKVPLDVSIRNWQYVDRLAGFYGENGCPINREPFGPLSGMLVPPCISHAVAIIEGLLALEQGVRSISLGYGQEGNLIQDIAAVRSLRAAADHYFQAAGYGEYQLSTVFHQWMGGFPESEARAYSVISWGGVIAALSKADKVIVKTPHEAMGIPTKEANLGGLLATRQSIFMASDLKTFEYRKIDEEQQVILKEVSLIMDRVMSLGSGNIADGAVRAFEAGVLDVPFAPSMCNAGKVIPVRDDEGAVRFFDSGNIPLDDDLKMFHKQKILERSVSEGRRPSYQMVIDDIYAVSKGMLVGRPK